MKKENKTKQKQDTKEDYQELKELLQRTQANFENYRKQTEKRIEEIQQMAGRNTIMQILPILDNFELAIKSNNNHTSEFIRGIELIYAQLNSLLEENSVKTIEVSDDFDPFYHEALMKVESDLSENKIIEVLQRGFTLHDKVIRHAKVKVSAGRKKEKENNGVKENV